MSNGGFGSGAPSRVVGSVSVPCQTRTSASAGFNDSSGTARKNSLKARILDVNSHPPASAGARFYLLPRLRPDRTSRPTFHRITEDPYALFLEQLEDVYDRIPLAEAEPLPLGCCDLPRKRIRP